MRLRRRSRKREICRSLGLGLLVACADAPPPPSFLVIVVDTLRADRLSAYDSVRSIAPFVDSLSDRSYVFERAYAASPWTSPSIGSLLTSRFPSQHGISGLQSVLTGGEITLAEVLRQSGYATGGFSANWLIRGELGYGQGFDEYRALRTHGKPFRETFARARTLNLLALAWLDGLAAERSKRFLLYLHYMEPHTPHHPSSAAMARMREGRPALDLVAVNEAAFAARKSPPGAAVLRDIEDAYDAEVATLDAELSSLFSQLGERGLLDNLVVVFTADHGEEFMDHGSLGHSHSLYDELIRVPLMIQLRRQSDRVVVAETVSLVDLAPTLADLAGAAIPPTFEGRSLAPLLLGSKRVGGAHPAFSELVQTPFGVRFTPHERAVVWGSWKLIAGVDGEREFYDHASDPAETNPLSRDARDYRELDRALENFTEHAAKSAAAPEVVPFDQETLKQARALGYVE